MTLSNDSTKRNEAFRRKVKREDLHEKLKVAEVSSARWPERVLRTATQAKLARRFGQGLQGRNDI